MLKYEYIRKEWIVSPTARTVYRGSALLSIALFFGVFLVVLEGGIPASIAPVARQLLFSGALGAGVTLVGMEYFLLRFDRSHPLQVLAWFCVLLFPFLGAPLYCFIVYSRADVVRSSCTKHIDSTQV